MRLLEIIDMNGDTHMIKSLHHMTTLFMMLLALSIALTGCEEEENKQVTKKPDVNNKDGDKDPTHDVDKDVEDNAAKPSVLQGTWRILKTDVDETPVVRVSIIMDDGAKEGSGDFTAQVGLGENFQGIAKNLDTVASNGDGFSLTFNPTNDQTEVYTVKTSSKIDENTFEGNFTSKTGTFNFPVKILKVQF